MRLGATFLIFLVLASRLVAAPNQTLPRGYVCYRASGKITIDGKLDEPAWKNAPWTEYHADIEGFAKPAPRFRTREKMLWDDKYLYIGAYLEEPHVWATLTKHDSVIFHDNDFEIFIDPDGNCHSYYEIEINALNTEWDLYLPKPYKDGGAAVDSFELPGIKHATHVYGTINKPSDIDKGWSVEFAIPWAALAQHANRPTPPGDGDQWRIDFSRVEWTTDIVNGMYVKRKGLREDNWIWSPQGVIDMHRPETWGFVQFTKGKPGTVRFHRDPDQATRMLLSRIYYAEKAFYAKNGYWTDRLDDLKPVSGGGKYPVKIELTADGFKASTLSLRRPARVCISQDSRIWIETTQLEGVESR